MTKNRKYVDAFIVPFGSNGMFLWIDGKMRENIDISYWYLEILITKDNIEFTSKTTDNTKNLVILH